MKKALPLKTALKAAVAQKIQSSVDLKKYKSSTRDMLQTDDGKWKRDCEIVRQRSHRSSLREDIRHLHLAYAFARGRTYLSQEPKIREDNYPRLGLVEHYLAEFVGAASSEAVLAWYKGEVIPQEAEAAE